MRRILTGALSGALILSLSATVAFAGPKPAAKKAHAMTAAQCATACTKAMKAKHMAGACPVSACKSGACPMMAKAGKMGAKKTHKM